MELVQSLEQAINARPLDKLGIHKTAKGWLIRTWQPGAVTVHVYRSKSNRLLGVCTCINSCGLFELEIHQKKFPGLYCLSVAFKNQKNPKSSPKIVDPFQFKQPADTSLWSDNIYAMQGTQVQDCQQYLTMGAQLQTQVVDNLTVSGVLFSLFAPNARSVSVIGDFNQWDGRKHPLQANNDGVWRLFIPALSPGQKYKFEIKDQEGHLLPHKSDPYAFFNEQFPSFASVITDHESYQWQDQEWCEKPYQNPCSQPLNIYEVHAGSFNDQCSNWQELGDQLIPYVKEMGFTHIELLPVTDFPFDGSWGYQPLSMFAPNSRLGSVDDFKAFIDRCHRQDIGIIIDWVAAHFPGDDHGLKQFDGSSLFEYSDHQKAWHPDWKSWVYDYGKKSVCDFLISSALFWLDRFHIDGIRVDAVASMIYLDYSREDGQWQPNVEGSNVNLEAVNFLKNLNKLMYLHFPKTLSIAEESTAYKDVTKPIDHQGLGFGFKWNMGWMHDNLNFFNQDTLYRQYHYQQLCFSYDYAFNENFILPLSHDEVVHGKGAIISKMPGDEWQQTANVKALFALQMASPGKKLNFMGNEIAQTSEWNYKHQVDWHLLDHDRHCAVQALQKKLNHLYTSQSAFFETDHESKGFTWLQRDDSKNSVIAFSRQNINNDQSIIVVSNLSPFPLQGYGLSVIKDGNYEVILNTDSKFYWGSNFDMGTRFNSIESKISINLPPLATIYLKHNN